MGRMQGLMPQTVDGVGLWRKLDVFCYRIGFRNYENSIDWLENLPNALIRRPG